MLKKALVISTVASTIDQFCMENIRILQSKYKVYVAANFLNGNNTSDERICEFKSKLDEEEIVYYQIDFERKPLSISNIKAIHQLNDIIKNNDFEIIHCHTPIASMILRLCAMYNKSLIDKIIYTAHGFHFYKGSSFFNWIIYYPIEKFLSRYTNTLITINKDDYKIAKKRFKARKILYIPGIGIDLKYFEQYAKKKYLKDIDIKEKSINLFSVGELNKNKNHSIIIKALNKINNKNIHYYICGKGELLDELKDLIALLNLENNVHLLGYRKDVKDIYKKMNVFVFPSKREGLSVALMEAMASGLPIICSNIRGNRDLILDRIGGFLVCKNTVEEYTNKILELLENKELMKSMSEYNKEKVKDFSTTKVNKLMEKIYFEKFNGIDE